MKLQRYGFGRNYAIMRLDFFLNKIKKPRSMFSEAFCFGFLWFYSFTNFNVPTTFSDFTVTKYTPSFKPSRLIAVMPLAC